MNPNNTRLSSLYRLPPALIEAISAGEQTSIHRLRAEKLTPTPGSIRHRRHHHRDGRRQMEGRARRPLRRIFSVDADVWSIIPDNDADKRKGLAHRQHHCGQAPPDRRAISGSKIASCRAVPRTWTDWRCQGGLVREESRRTGPKSRRKILNGYDPAVAAEAAPDAKLPGGQAADPGGAISSKRSMPPRLSGLDGITGFQAPVHASDDRTDRATPRRRLRCTFAIWSAACQSQHHGRRAPRPAVLGRMFPSAWREQRRYPHARDRRPGQAPGGRRY